MHRSLLLAITRRSALIYSRASFSFDYQGTTAAVTSSRLQCSRLTHLQRPQPQRRGARQVGNYGVPEAQRGSRLARAGAFPAGCSWSSLLGAAASALAQADCGVPKSSRKRILRRPEGYMFGAPEPLSPPSSPEPESEAEPRGSYPERAKSAAATLTAAARAPAASRAADKEEAERLQHQAQGAAQAAEALIDREQSAERSSTGARASRPADRYSRLIYGHAGAHHSSVIRRSIDVSVIDTTTRPPSALCVPHTSTLTSTHSRTEIINNTIVTVTTTEKLPTLTHVLSLSAPEGTPALGPASGDFANQNSDGAQRYRGLVTTAVRSLHRAAISSRSLPTSGVQFICILISDSGVIR